AACRQRGLRFVGERRPDSQRARGKCVHRRRPQGQFRSDLADGGPLAGIRRRGRRIRGDWLQLSAVRGDPDRGREHRERVGTGRTTTATPILRVQGALSWVPDWRDRMLRFSAGYQWERWWILTDTNSQVEITLQGPFVRGEVRW